jgi:hypothetical protein
MRCDLSDQIMCREHCDEGQRRWRRVGGAQTHDCAGEQIANGAFPATSQTPATAVLGICAQP